jgi:capsular exopolysaccharide synthesis family protein
MRGLRRRWVAAVCLGGGLAAAAAVAAWMLMSPKYTAVARVRVLYDPRILPGGQPSDFRTYIRTQAQQFYNRNVISAALRSEAVKRLNLEDRYADPAQQIDEDLKIDHPEDSEIITVSLSNPDPAVATTLLKALTDAYLELIVYVEERAKAARVTELEKVHGEAWQNLKKDKELLDKMAQDQGTADPAILAQRSADAASNMMYAQQRRNDVAMQLLNAQAEIEALDARAQAAKDPTGPTPAAVRAAVEADPELRDMGRAAERLQSFLDDLADRGYPSDGPTPTTARSRLVKLKKKIEGRRKVVEEEARARLMETAPGREAPVSRTHLVNRLEALKKIYNDLEKEVKEQQALKAKWSRSIPDYEAARAKLQSQEQTVNDIGRQLEAGRVELRGPKRITIAQEAELQRKDIKKQVMVTAVAPLMVLGAVCMGLAYAECRQRRVLRASEVARGLGIPVVGAVPELPQLAQHLVGPDGSTELEGHPVLESIDAIRTLLVHAGDTRVVLVTSAGTGEGKTTLAAHLAGSLARAGRKTLLLDGDLRNPAAHQLLEMPPQPGFSEALLGEVELADAVRPTALDGLSFLAAGQWDREVMQALARGGLEGLFERLRAEFDFVVIDSHPVLAATDALQLGRQADAAILSVLREVSQVPRVWAAAQRLAALDIRVLGAVVNAADPDEALTAAAGSRAAA